MKGGIIITSDERSDSDIDVPQVCWVSSVSLACVHGLAWLVGKSRLRRYRMMIYMTEMGRIDDEGKFRWSLFCDAVRDLDDE